MSLTNISVSTNVQLIVRRALLAAIVLGCTLLGNTALVSAVTFPIDGNNDFTANVIRRYDNGALLSSISHLSSTNANLISSPANAIDGGRLAAQWNLTGGIGDPTATGTLQITLDQSYDIGRIDHIYQASIYQPANYEFRLSNTGFGTMTSVVTNPTPAKFNSNVITPFTAQYMEYTWTGGGPTHPNVLLSQIEAFSDAGGPAMNSQGGWNVVALQSSAPIAVTNLTPSNWLDDVNRAVDLKLDDPFYLRGNGTAGDAKFLLDLGSTHLLESVTMGMYHGQVWNSGAQVELSRDGVNFSTVFDSNTSTGSALDITFTPQTARYIRVTDKNSANGALVEFQVFADALPTLAEMPLSGSTINVGDVLAFSTETATDAISLTNDGELTSELLVLSYSISGPDAAIFDVPDFLPVTLTAGGSDNVLFDLVATVGDIGLYDDAVLTINTNVGDILFNLSANSIPVPEPSSLFCLSAAFGLLLVRGRRRRTNGRHCTLPNCSPSA